MSALPAISAFYRLAGQVRSPDEGKTSGFTQYKWALIDPPATLKFDAANNPHLGVDLPVYGFGFDVATSPGEPQTVNLDTSSISFRVQAPSGPGPCVDPVTGLPYGTGVWAVDEGYVYFAVPAPQTGPVLARQIIDMLSVILPVSEEVPGAVAGGFVWGRMPLATTW